MRIFVVSAPRPKWEVVPFQGSSDMPYKTHKIALDPNNKQRVWFTQQCGYARFAYNHALADFKSALENDEFLSTSKLNERFNVAKKAYAWTQTQDQVVANKSIFVNLSAARCGYKHIGNVF